MSERLTIVFQSTATLPVWAQRAAMTRALALPIQLSELQNSACSLDLTSADHEAIQYFRTTFARIHHTKNPDYSLFSIIFTIAEREPMVMRVLLALGGQEMEWRRNSDTDDSDQLNGCSARDGDSPSWTPIQHYSAALRLLADALGSGDDGQQLDLDTICTTLYLMLVYEQKYGDAACSGLSNHPAGAALIVKHRCQNLRLQIASQDRHKTPVLTSQYQSTVSKEQPQEIWSLLLTRLLVWIALIDSAAAAFGVGGQFNRDLASILGPEDPSPLNGFDNLHRFTNALYRMMWAESYPQEELLDDVENRDIFAFLCACMQLRFMVADLGHLDSQAVRQNLPVINSAFQQFDQQYGEMLEVAAKISPATDNSRRLVANIRAFTPIYHAVKLELMRTCQSVGVAIGMDIVPAAHMKHILDLAVQAYKHQGDDAMVRIAWPLFVVCLETDDQRHRAWILGVFRGISRYGKNHSRAFQFLQEAIELRDCLGEKINVREHIEATRGELFVI
ncbi:hypothetical protein PT974_05696 [Cladobotryum mycophilum]|uniref:Uncharacterized protein n=1 Tax=Cladobotryum mycophilum TaxID=491253 RepID=A0ABR0SKL8_9HYPO